MDEHQLTRKLLGSIPNAVIKNCKFEGITFVLGDLRIPVPNFDVDENGQVVAPGSVELTDEQRR